MRFLNLGKQTPRMPSHRLVQRCENQLRATTAIVAGLILSACSSSAVDQLEKVAKDWSLTIRASQIIPVYPLRADFQPGDVFLVSTSIKDQVSLYEQKGFLPTEQLVVRLSDLPYEDFYKKSYFEGEYDKAPHEYPIRTTSPPQGGGNGELKVPAPRAAFPTYNFTVDRSKGLKLALPISGVPLGLGYIDAKTAVGTVAINDAYTYGIDGETAYRKLKEWHENDPKIAKTLREMARNLDSEIYLRFVTRVYMAGGVSVSLASTKSQSGGVDGGQAPKVMLQSLLPSEAGKITIEEAKKVYDSSLTALSEPFNKGKAGGGLRFTHLGHRSISLEETFESPLVIGFVGFDVKVSKDGRISVPIPSFSVLSDKVTAKDFDQSITYANDDGLSDRYYEWLKKPGNQEKAEEFLNECIANTELSDLDNNLELRGLLIRMGNKFGFI